MSSPAFTITLLADRPDLAAGWAEMHWREWGDEPGSEELLVWVEDALKAMGRTTIPVAFIAVGRDGEVLGGMGVHQFDPEERHDRSPWIVGMIVRADRRGEGIGQALIARLDAWTREVGIERLWVATEHASAFYQRCGYQRVEELRLSSGEIATILTRTFVSPPD